MNLKATTIEEDVVTKPEDTSPQPETSKEPDEVEVVAHSDDDDEELSACCVINGSDQ